MTEINTETERLEALGPAEKIVQTLISGVDHMVHNRPGIVVQDRSSNIGVKWYPVTHKTEEGQATCEDGEHLPFIVQTSACLAESVKRYVSDGNKSNYQITPAGTMRL